MASIEFLNYPQFVDPIHARIHDTRQYRQAKGFHSVDKKQAEFSWQLTE